MKKPLSESIMKNIDALLNLSDEELVDLCGFAQGWVDYPSDPLEQGTIWHLPRGNSPFEKVLEKRNWNPLENDADAFRLAMEMGLRLRCPSSKNQVYLEVESITRTVFPITDDACKAMRRAIVLNVIDGFLR